MAPEGGGPGIIHSRLPIVVEHYTGTGRDGDPEHDEVPPLSDLEIHVNFPQSWDQLRHMITKTIPAVVHQIRAVLNASWV